MRKRLVIGAIAVAVIGIVLCLVSSWHADTIEHHVQGYAEEYRWSAKELWLSKRAPAWVGRFVRNRKRARLDGHRQALVRLGFLQDVTVVLSNASTIDVVNKVTRAGSENVDPIYWVWYYAPTNVVRFVAKSRDVETLAKLIREADVPETK